VGRRLNDEALRGVVESSVSWWPISRPAFANAARHCPSSVPASCRRCWLMLLLVLPLSPLPLGMLLLLQSFELDGDGWWGLKWRGFLSPLMIRLPPPPPTPIPMPMPRDVSSEGELVRWRCVR